MSETILSFDPQLTPKRQIIHLLTLILAGALCAIALTFLTLYYYNPEAHYVVKNALLSPQTLKLIKKPRPGKRESTNSEHLYFSYQDPISKKNLSNPIDLDVYQKFYQLISEDQSLNNLPPDLPGSFDQRPAASLILNVANNQDEDQKFQEIQFLPQGDYYRVQLREAQTTRWIYFYHAHIYDKAMDLLRGEAI